MEYLHGHFQTGLVVHTLSLCYFVKQGMFAPSELQVKEGSRHDENSP